MMLAEGDNNNNTNEDDIKRTLSKKSKIAVGFVLLALLAVAGVTIYHYLKFGQDFMNRLLMDSFFFSMIGVIAGLIIELAFISWNPLAVGKETLSVNENLKFVIYKLARTLALVTYFHVNAWILFASPWSFAGHSWYGFFMQLILAVPMFFIMMNFWVSRSSAGLFILAIANLGMFPLSFYFPTLFANFYAVSTSNSAMLGGKTVYNFAAVDPMSYQKSMHLKPGRTEESVGPNVEQISDKVVDVSLDIGGRMCDDEDIDGTLIVSSQSKYELHDITVYVSSMKDVYSKISRNVRDLCNVDFDKEKDGKQSSYVYTINKLPKGTPNIKHFTFTTHIDDNTVNEQICYMRGDVIMGYHTTSIFPLSFIDYNSYLINPVNINTPTSISSFGKIRIDMSVGQQPVPLKKGEDKTLKLKVGWAQKSDGIVSDPTIYLFLPKDLGKCIDTNEVINGGIKGPDFQCFDDINKACSDFASSVSGGNYIDQYAALSNESEIMSLSLSNSFEVPGLDSSCKSLLNEGYTLCKSKSVSKSDILACTLDLSNVNVNSIDMNTYLIRADAKYEFHNVLVKSYKIENCDVS